MHKLKAVFLFILDLTNEVARFSASRLNDGLDEAATRGNRLAELRDISCAFLPLLLRGLIAAKFREDKPA